MAYKCKAETEVLVAADVSGAHLQRSLLDRGLDDAPPGAVPERGDPEEVRERAGRGQAAADGVAGDRQGLGCEPAAIPRGPADRAKGDGLALWDEFRDLVAEERRRSRRAVARFVAAVRANDVAALCDSIDGVETSSAWAQAFRHSARLPDVADEVRLAMLELWKEGGDHLRSQVGDDRTLLAGLRVLLPRYEGPPIVLYRGDSLWNWRRRSYGFAWSADEAVADAFARGLWRTVKGGSAVLRVQAPPNAVICDTGGLLPEDRYGEAEYIVDRRLLRRVQVLQRYAQEQP